MELEVSHKVRAAIKAKLVELGVHVDEELPDYIMVLIANRRAPPQMESDLNLFLGDQTHRFVSWLTLVLKKLEQVTAAASTTTPTTPTPPVEPTPVVSSKKRKSSNKEPEGDGGGSSSSTEDKSSPVKSKKKKQDSPVIQQEDQPKESSPPPRQSSKDKEPEESCPKKTHEDPPQPDKDLEKMRHELLKSKKSTSNSPPPPPRANHSKSPQNKPTRNKSRSRSPIRRHHNNRERTLSTRSSNKHTRSRSRSPPQQPPSKYTPRTSVFQRLLNRNRRSRSRSRSPPPSQPVPQRKTLSSIVVKKKIESIIKQNETTKKLPSQVVKIGQPRTRPMITIDSSSSPPKPSKLLLRAVSEANKDALSSHGDKIISRIEVDKKVEMKLTGKETGSRRSRDDDDEDRVRSGSNNYDDDVDLEYKVSRTVGSAAPAPQFLEFNRRVVNNNRVVVGDEVSKPRKSVLERLGKRVVNYHHQQQLDGSRGRSVLDRLGEREGLFENIVVRVDGGGGCDEEDDDEGEEEGDDGEDDVFGGHQQLRATTHSPSSSTASGGGLPGSLALKHDSSNRIQRISIRVNDDDTSEDEDDDESEEEEDKQINNNQDNDNETHTNDSKHKVTELEEQEDVIVLQEGSPIRDEEVVDDDEDEDTRKSVSSYDEVVEEVIDDDGEDSLTGKKTKTEDEDVDNKKLVDLRERIVKKQVSKKKALEEESLSSKIDKVRETVSSISFDEHVFSLVPPIQHSSSNTVTCKYWPNCTYKNSCVYNHPVCKYNPCTNENCAYKHVGSQQKKVIGVKNNKGGLKLSGSSTGPSICKFFPKCHNLDCKFYHPTPCRFGLGCKDKNCKYFHPGGKVMGGSSSSSLPHKSLLKWEKK